MNKSLDISVVVPLYNEAESLPELVAWIDRVATTNGLTYEIVMVDDGSTDDSWSVVERLKQEYSAIRGISFARNYGKSAALYCGFEMAEGEVVFTMDADLQDSPDEIPEMRRMILEEGYDLVSGWKKKRYDPVGKRWPSKFFNFTARVMSGIKLHDFNCGLRPIAARWSRASRYMARCIAISLSLLNTLVLSALARRWWRIRSVSMVCRSLASSVW